MRRLGFGLAAALLIAALTSASFAAAEGIDPAARTQGMKEAPAAVAAAALPCTVSDAIFVGAADSPKGATKYYEVACKEGLGFVVMSNDKAPPPTAVDCVMVGTPGADGKTSNLACKLPANHALANTALQPLVTKSGHDCTVDKERYAGSTADENIYEVSCAGAGGYILEVARNYGGTPKATDCLEYDTASNLKCNLITRDQQFAAVDKLAAASGRPCTIKDRRHVGVAPDGSGFYEFACTDGTGFMVQTDASGKFSQAIDCAKAGYIGSGCTLTDMQKVQAAANARYADLAKAAGFDCAVSKFASFPGNGDGTDVIEMSCSNRPDGGVGFFPPSSSSDHPRVLNCLRAAAEGFRCSMTPMNVLYDGMTAQLKAKGRGSCVVSDARAMAVTTSKGSSGYNDLIEVACADGGPGLVLEYDYGSSSLDDVRNCAQSKTLNGGCQLPRKKVG